MHSQAEVVVKTRYTCQKKNGKGKLETTSTQKKKSMSSTRDPEFELIMGLGDLQGT